MEAEKQAATPGTEGKAAEPSRSGQARQDVYAKYATLQSVESAVAPDLSATDTEQESDSASETQDAVKPVSQPDSSSATEEPKKDKQERKTVPKEALDEEREKRKQANLRLREMEARTKELEERLKQSSSRQQETGESLLTSSSTEEVVKQLQQQVSSLEEKLKQTSTKAEEEEKQKAIASREGRLKKMDKELMDDGFPGFYETLWLTSEAVNKRFREGLLNQVQLDDELEWKAAYKEDVYPTVSHKFKKIEKDETMQKKLDAKKKAALASNAGKAPETDKSEQDKKPTFDELNKSWIQARNENSPNRRRR